LKAVVAGEQVSRGAEAGAHSCCSSAECSWLESRFAMKEGGNVDQEGMQQRAAFDIGKD